MTKHKIKIIGILLDIADGVDNMAQRSCLMYAIGYLEAVWGLTEGGEV